MPVVTDSNTALRARFDMLLSDEMKQYVKEMGGGSYIRNLVLQDLLSKLRSTMRTNLTTADKERIERMYNAEINRMEGQVA